MCGERSHHCWCSNLSLRVLEFWGEWGSLYLCLLYLCWNLKSAIKSKLKFNVIKPLKWWKHWKTKATCYSLLLIGEVSVCFLLIVWIGIKGRRLSWILPQNIMYFLMSCRWSFTASYLGIYFIQCGLWLLICSIKNSH